MPGLPLAKVANSQHRPQPTYACLARSTPSFLCKFHTPPDTVAIIAAFRRSRWCTRQDSNLWPLPSEGSALSS